MSRRTLIVAVGVSSLLASSALIGVATTASANVAPPTMATLVVATATTHVPPGITRLTGKSFLSKDGYTLATEDSTAGHIKAVDARSRVAVRTYKGQPSDTLYLQLAPGKAAKTAKPIKLLYGNGKLPAGWYNVTVTVGDTKAFNSVDRLTVNGVRAIKDYRPTKAKPVFTNTVAVHVTSGWLTVDAAGGTNTKLMAFAIKPVVNSHPTQPTSPVTPTTSAHPTTTTPTVHPTTSAPATHPTTPVRTTAPPTTSAAPTTTGPTEPPSHLVSISPTNGQTGVSVDTSIVVVLSRTIDRSVELKSAFSLTNSSGAPVAFNASTDAADQTIHINPQAWLNTSATYTIASTSSLKTPDGQAVTPFAATFTTASTTPVPPSLKFTKTVIDSSASMWTVGTKGPDGNLYMANAVGLIRVFAPSGNTFTKLYDIPAYNNRRTVLGLAFAPGSTAGHLDLYLTDNDLGNQNVPDYTGHIGELTGPDYAHLTSREAIVGLPRACKDHETNSLAFGPDGKLYISQGAPTAYGTPEEAWCNYQESVMSSAILVADVVNDSRFHGTSPVDVSDADVINKTSGNERYNPFAANAPVRIFAEGLRNPYGMIWASNGQCYAPVNESSGGYTPPVPSLGLPSYYVPTSYDDFLAYCSSKSPSGGVPYFGHPNTVQDPTHGILNGGNPTAGADPYEVAYQDPAGKYTAYPVGTKPDADFVPSQRYDLKLHCSPDGIAEYQSSGSPLDHNLIISDFACNDVRALRLDSYGRVAAEQTIIPSTQLYSPLAIVQWGTSLVIGNFGDGNSGQGGYIALYTPQ